jgi:pentatricopeptide repeat protein
VSRRVKHGELSIRRNHDGSSGAVVASSQIPKWSRDRIVADRSSTFFHATVSSADNATASQTRQLRSKEDLLALVDQSEAGSVDEHFNFFKDPYLRGYAQADGPNLVVSSKKDDVEYPSTEQVTLANTEEQKMLWDLRHAVVSRLRSPLRVDLDTIYRLYQGLPEPRMSYIPARLRHQLLRVLSQPEKKDSKSMLRYFAVVADVKNSGLSLTLAQWNSAMSLASRYVGTSTDAEAETALKLWREMEQDAGIKGNDVTFNILFDVASKAGNFTLAEMLYQEMEARGLSFNRYHYVSLIHFFGLKLDADGVRAAYKEMVNAGEIIDTVALNCVISGLLRSGEEDAADRVYERMKKSDRKVMEMPSRNYLTNKMMTKVLQMFAKVGRQHPVLAPNFQGMASLIPDLHTYRILINHYAVKVGNLAKVTQFLDEMRFFQIPLHGAVFLALFKSFHLHGGFDGSAWSEQRLNNVWSAFLEAVDGPSFGLTIETWLAVWALRAFKKCSSDEAVLKAYEELDARWNLDESDARFMTDFLTTVLSKETVYRTLKTNNGESP